MSDDRVTVETPPTASSAEDVEEPPLEEGSRLGDYIVNRRIATGGCGAVYAATHHLLGRAVAIKVLHKSLLRSSTMVHRFMREALAVNSIRHPNIVDIVEIFGLDATDERPFCVMELLEGATVSDLIRKQGRLDLSTVGEILTSVCAALGAAHKAGFVHRDLKPSNVMVATVGGTQLIKLLDFGVAKLVTPDPRQPGLTVAGTKLGTTHYMPPEQIRGEAVDARADVYSLGVMTYQMLTGLRPFRGETQEEIEAQHLNAPPPQASRLAPLPVAIDAVLVRAMDKVAANRFATPEAFFEAFRRAAASGSSSVPETTKVRNAVALAVVGRAADGSETELDDEQFEELEMALERARTALSAAGFTPSLETTLTIVGTKLLPEDVLLGGKAAGAVEAVAADLARTLRQTIEQELSPKTRIDIEVKARVGEAVVNADGEVIDGDVLRVV